MKVYIAGPMSGLPNFNRAAFNHAHFHLWSKGHIVLNPARLPDGLTQADYMDITDSTATPYQLSVVKNATNQFPSRGALPFPAAKRAPVARLIWSLYASKGGLDGLRHAN